MAFGYVRRIAMARGQRCGRGNFEEDVHADGEIRSVEQRCARVHYLAFDLAEMLIPARSAHNDRRSVSDTCFHVFQDRIRIGEVDHDIDIAEAVSSKRSAISVVAGGKNLNTVPPLSRDFIYE